MKTTNKIAKKATKNSGKKKPGLTEGQAMNDLAVAHLVYEAHRMGMSYAKCETQFGLKQSKGFYAMRICRRVEEMAKQRKTK